MSSWTIWEPSFLPNQALKYISCLQWLISPNSVWSCPMVSLHCLLWYVSLLAADTMHMQSPGDLAKQVCYLANFWLEKSLFSLKNPIVIRANLSFLQERFLFFVHASPHFLLGTSGSFCIFLKFIFILFILFTSITFILTFLSVIS